MRSSGTQKNLRPKSPPLAHYFVVGKAKGSKTQTADMISWIETYKPALADKTSPIGLARDFAGVSESQVQHPLCRRSHRLV